MTKLINKIISLHKRRTSMRLADSEWEAMDEICRFENISRNKLLEFVEQCKDKDLGLSCCTRLFLLSYYKNNARLKFRPSGKNLMKALQIFANQTSVRTKP